jgi:hypothetical protein
MLLGAVALMLAGVTLRWRVETLSHQREVILGARPIQLMYNRMLAVRILAYSRRYGRPAYYLDSVVVHLDSAEAELVHDLRTDLWGQPVMYGWSYCGFSIGSSGETAGRPAHVEVVRLSTGRSTPLSWISERFSWPPEVLANSRRGRACMDES